MKILKEIQETLISTNGLLQMLDMKYDFIVEERDKFPLLFVDKTGIKAFLENSIALRNEEIILINKSINSKSTETANEISKLKLQSKKELLAKLSMDKHRELYFYEDLLLMMSDLKHKARQLWKHTMALTDSIENNADYFQAQLLLEESQEYLKDKGFKNASADLRKSFLNSLKDLQNFKMMAKKAKGLRDTSRELLINLEADEVNFRKFAERNNNINGF